jgi:hypothetical protein
MKKSATYTRLRAVRRTEAGTFEKQLGDKINHS